MVVYAGVFETDDKAQRAFDKLLERGLKADNLFVVTPSDGAAKVKEILGSARNIEFRGMANRLKAAVESGHTLLGVRPELFFARRVDETFAEVGAEKVLIPSNAAPRFFSDVIGIPSLILRGRPRVTLWKRPVTETLGKTMLYKRPVTETIGKRMLLPSKPITESWLGKKMLMESKPITQSWLGKKMLMQSKPITSRIGKKMLMKSKPITERLGKTMVYSEISDRD